jgi:high affinity Mn2+ porin
MRYRLRHLQNLRSVRHAARAPLSWIVAGAIAAPACAAELPLAMPVKAPVLVKAPVPQLYDWTGPYLGAHLGYAWGSSNWSEQPDGLSDTLNMFQRYDAFAGTGSWFGGFQAGYDYMLPNRVVIGAVADLSAPSWRSLNGVSIGGISTFNSPSLGQESLTETVLDMGTVRGRVGYAPGNWLFYATGGFAWAYDRLTMTQLDNSGTTDSPFLWRFGWAAGAGVEMSAFSA